MILSATVEPGATVTARSARPSTITSAPTPSRGPIGYRIAVLKGFSGTLADWIATLAPDPAVSSVSYFNISGVQVSTGAAGSDASATIAQTDGGQVIDFVIPRGDTGEPGTDGNTIWNGSGAPGSGVGTDGDFYIDKTNNRLYGPKAEGAWPGTYVSLVGPQGDIGEEGPPGTNGNTIWNGSGAPGSGVGVDGDFYIDKTNGRLYGPKAAGAWPGTYLSLVGPPGPGNVTGPSSATVGNLAAFEATNGEAIEDTGIAAGDIDRLSQAQTVAGQKTFSQPLILTDGMQVGAGVSIGWYHDGTNAAVRVPTEGGAFYAQTPSGAAAAPIYAATRGPSENSGFVPTTAWVRTALAYVTPMMFSAAGDGVTDDWDAIYNALNSGLPVYIDRAYAVYNQATFNPAGEDGQSCMIFGSGGNRSQIVCRGNVNPLVIYLGQTGRAVLRDFRIVAAAASSGSGINIQGNIANGFNKSCMKIDNIEVMGAGGYFGFAGIYTQDVYEFHVNHAYVMGGNGTSGSAIQLQAINNGVYNDAPRDTTYSNCLTFGYGIGINIAPSGDGNQYYSNDAQGIKIRDCTMQFCDTGISMVSYEDTSDGHSISGCVFNVNSVNVNTENVKFCHIHGNRFQAAANNVTGVAVNNTWADISACKVHDNTFYAEGTSGCTHVITAGYNCQNEVYNNRSIGGGAGYSLDSSDYAFNNTII